LKDGVYDDDECDGLTEEEIYAFYGFQKTGETVLDDEDPDQLDDEGTSVHKSGSVRFFAPKMGNHRPQLV